MVHVIVFAYFECCLTYVKALSTLLAYNSYMVEKETDHVPAKLPPIAREVPDKSMGLKEK